MRIGWMIYGDLGQPTGGYVYDRLVVGGLRALGDEVTVCDPRETRDDLVRSFTAVVGDALCIPHLGPIFERMAGGPLRVLLIHHLTSWEAECETGRAARDIETRAIVASDRLVVTGSATASRLAADHPGRSIAVVAPGADRLPRLPRGNLADGIVELLFVGSITRRKRLHLLLDAVERVVGSRLVLTVAGDWGREPEYSEGVAARIRDSAVLSACTRIVGVADDGELARLMARACALVLPSSLEGYGMVLSEALHAGLTAIASREAASAAGFEADDRVTVFDDPEDLVRAIQRLTDPKIGRSGPKALHVERLPRWSETVAAFRGLLTAPP